MKSTNLIDLSLFQGGLSSGYKQSIADKEVADETYTAEGIALIQISGTSDYNNKAVQVDVVYAHWILHFVF